MILKKVIPLVLTSSVLCTAASASETFYNINEKEKGNTFMQSTPTELPCSVIGHIDSNTTDIDFYSFNVSESIDLSIALNVLHPNITSLLRIELYDTSLNMICNGEFAYENSYSGFIPINKKIEKGHYYIKIYAEPSADIVNVPYMLDISSDENVRDTSGYVKKSLLKTEISAVNSEDIIKSEIKANENFEELYNWTKELAEKNKQDLSTINDPLSAFQYYIPQINLIDAWKETMGNPEIKVAVIDQGIDTSIFDLSATALPVYNVRGNEITSIMPVDHGNHVSGLICAAVNNGTGVAGVAPNITLMPINAWDDSVKKRTDEDTAKAIRYAADNGARVLSMSIGNQNHINEDGDVPIIREAVKYAHDKGVLMVACTQNAAKEVPDYPARYPEVIAVGAIEGNGEMWPDSNKGAEIVAPGYDVVSLATEGQYLSLSGTSMSTPIVAGAAALILSKNPTLSNEEVRTILQQSATDLGDFHSSGYGLLNVAKALEMTPVSENVNWKTDKLNGQWYSDAVNKIYLQGYYRDKDFDVASMSKALTKSEWLETLKKYTSIALSTEDLISYFEISKSDLSEPVSRNDAFEILAKTYCYLYGEQSSTGVELLTQLKLISGRSDGELALDQSLTTAEGAQILYNLDCLINQ